ncbi:DUF6332 family protein [Streptomyces sp. NPDC088785]|uniref:DUF6332 family protein n=1 Tax=Streptomyces sp. NPDC088785 TaxID=3365897 RepID=UPI0038250B5B
MTHTGDTGTTGGRAHRTQAERDAMTVEIGFALFTGALLAGAVFALLMLPAFLGLAPGGSRAAHCSVAGLLAAVVFLVRVVRVLARFDRQRSAPERTVPRA